MNSIVFTHVHRPWATADVLEVALHRLGAWLDEERDTLGRVLAQAGRRSASDLLESLDQLHLDPGATSRHLRELLEDARSWLSTLLDVVSHIPSRCRLETAWGLPGPASFDTHLRWSAARLADILATLDRALDD